MYSEEPRKYAWQMITNKQKKKTGSANEYTVYSLKQNKCTHALHQLHLRIKQDILAELRYR